MKSAHATPPAGPPFGTFEAFLFEVMTLRSNAAYRSDIDLLMMYEEEPKDWIAQCDVNERPYQAARNVIAVWELVCSVVKGHYGTQRKAFIDAVPSLAGMYLWMVPVIEKIEGDNKNSYAPSFQDLGSEAAKDLPALHDAWKADGSISSYKDFLDLSPRRRYRVYRSAWREARPLTHFG